MRIYRDLLSNDELFSDAYKIITSEDGSMLTFETKMVSRKEGQIDDALIGGNASAEEASEDLESTVVSGLDCVLAHKLVEKQFVDKKDFAAYLKRCFKELMAVIQEKSPDKLDDFKKTSQDFAVHWMKKFKDITVYIGESQDERCLPVIALWNDDGVSATMYAYKLGTWEEKF